MGVLVRDADSERECVALGEGGGVCVRVRVSVSVFVGVRDVVMLCVGEALSASDALRLLAVTESARHSRRERGRREKRAVGGRERHTGTDTHVRV